MTRVKLTLSVMLGLCLPPCRGAGKQPCLGILLACCGKREDEAGHKLIDIHDLQARELWPGTSPWILSHGSAFTHADGRHSSSLTLILYPYCRYGRGGGTRKTHYFNPSHWLLEPHGDSSFTGQEPDKGILALALVRGRCTGGFL